MINVKTIILAHWVEDEDLRKINRRARYIAMGTSAGEAVLVTNTRLGRRGERFRLVVRDLDHKVWVLTPPIDDGDLSSLFVKLHRWVAESF